MVLEAMVQETTAMAPEATAGQQSCPHSGVYGPVRVLGAADLDALLRLEAMPSAPLSSPQALAQALEDDQRLLLGIDRLGPAGDVGVEGGLDAGMTGQRAIHAYALLARQPFEAELEAILVAPQARRQGLAARLLTSLIAVARQWGSERLLLEVRADNGAAIACYRAAGFAEDGVRRGYYPPLADGGERVDALLMSLALD